MKEIIEILNQTGTWRVILYCIVFLVALSITAGAIVNIIETLIRRR